MRLAETKISEKSAFLSKKMIRILAPESSKRLNYTCKQLFQEILPLDYEIVQEANSNKTIHIAYGCNWNNALSIHSSALMFEENIHPLDESVAHWENIPVLFLDKDGSFDLGFDLFANVFYHLSRYEEYVKESRDSYGRFLAEESFLFKNHALQKAVVNELAEKLFALLKQNDKLLNRAEKKFKIYSTFDIDHLYKYKCKGLVRSCGAFLRDALSFNFNEVKRRFSALFRGEKDPFDCYDYLLQIHEKYNTKATFFILNKHQGAWDKAVDLSQKSAQNVLLKLAEKAVLGIHPSAFSFTHHESLEEEKKQLEHWVNKKTNIARQHFLFSRLPQPYLNYIENGIATDFSMAYASQSGFRAGTSSSFYFYDLQNNQETSLKLIPLIWMDATQVYYQPQNKSSIVDLIEYTKLFNTEASILFHNDLLLDENLRGLLESALKTL